MLPDSNPRIHQRAEALFLEHRQHIYRRTDRVFACLMVLQWLAAIAAAYWVSPLTWAGAYSQTHIHVRAAIFLGGLITVFPVALALLRPGSVAARYVIAVGQMLMSALLIHLTGGRLETHFHVFGSLAFLAFYRDWKIFLPAAAVVAADHFLRGVYWPESVYGVASTVPWRWLEHAAWVVFEVTFLTVACVQSVREMRDIAWQRAQLEVANETTERTVLERTAELRASEERFRSLSAASPIGIFETDREGRVTYVNARWGEIAGLSSEQTMGDGWTGAVHPDDLEAVTKLWSDVVREGRECTTEFRVRTPQGEIRWVLARSNPIVSADGRVTGHVGTTEDMSARKRVEIELAEARDRALDAARLKSEFLANMSHEIRTPMNAIIGMTDMTLDTEIDDEQREYLEMVRHSALALLTLINDILDVSKIESGRLEMEVQPFDLRDGLNDVLRTLALRAHQKGLELACDVRPRVPDCIVGDPGRLRQVVLNLVGNAIKFTDQGEVVMRVDVETLDDHRVVLHFAVSDTGIGIAASQQSLIFAPFVQADGSMTRQYGGTGLGLTIASQLVEMMAGKIWLDSTPGRGSTFHFTAAFEVAEDARSPRAPSPGARALRVLVVDDSSTSLAIFLEMLGSWGIAADGAASGAQSLAALGAAHDEGRPFGLLLIDTRMPDMEGATLARLIRNDPRLRTIPIIMLTTAAAHGDRAGDVSDVTCIMKPIARSHLLEAIESATGTHATPGQGARPAVSDHHKSLRVLVAEDNAMNRKVVVRMLEKRGHKVVAVVDGRAALAAVSEPFDLVLMDVQMPNMNGLEATMAIRDHEKRIGGHVPIVALTAHAMKGDRERCLDAGMDAYVSKPVEAATLFATIEALGTGARQDGEEATPANPTEVLDYAALRARVDDDSELLLEVIAEFRRESVELLALLRRAISARDSAAIARYAHSLKGALATLAAQPAAEAAARLDGLARKGDLSQIELAWRALTDEMARLESALGASEPPQVAAS